MPRLYFRKATARTEIISGCFGNPFLRTFGHWSRGPAARTPFVVPSPATLGHRTSTRGGNDNGELPIAYEDFLQIWPASSARRPFENSRLLVDRGDTAGLAAPDDSADPTSRRFGSVNSSNVRPSPSLSCAFSG